MWRKFVAVLCVVNMVAGCSLFRSEQPVQDVPEPKPAAEIEAPAVKKVPEPPRFKPLPPPTPNFEPSGLVGLDEAQVLAQVGEPNSREEQIPARIWRYAANECIVSLYFYLDLGDEKFHLLSHETNQRNGDADAAQRCYNQVFGQHTGQ